MEEITNRMRVQELHLKEPQKVFQIYDGIEVICYYQHKGNNYISIWYDETEEYLSWCYAKINQEEFDKLKLKELDLRSIFKNKKVYEVASKLKMGIKLLA